MRNESRNSGWLRRKCQSLFVCFVVLAAAFSLNRAAHAAGPNWLQVSGGTSSDGPALTFYHDIPILAARANDASGAIWYSINQGDWHKVSTGVTNAAPVLVTFEDMVLLIHTGQDGNPYYMMLDHSIAAPVNWSFHSNWTQIPGFNSKLATNLRVALTSDGPRLFVFGTYLDKSMHYTLNVPNINPVLQWSSVSNEIPGGGFTNSSLAAVADGGAVTVYQTGTDNNGYVNSLNLTTNAWVNSSWVQLATIDRRLKFGPSAVITGDGNQGMCAVDSNLLAIACMSLKVVGGGMKYNPVIAYNNIPWNLEIPPDTVPVTHHAVTLAYAGGGLVSLVVTVQDPNTNLPLVLYSDPAPFSTLIPH